MFKVDECLYKRSKCFNNIYVFKDKELSAPNLY